MSLESIINVTISLETAQVSRANFGVPLIAAFHTHWTDRVRTYSASSMLATMVTEGFATTETAYILAQKLLAANPRVRTLKIGRRDGATVQIVNLVPAVANSTLYSVTVNGTTVSFTSDGSATLAEILAGLETVVDALPLVTATDVSTTHLAVTTTAAGTLSSITTTANISSLDVSVDADIEDDLNAIRAADADWYALLIDSNATAEILETADWAESQKVVFFAQTADSETLNPASTTDIADDLDALDYARTALIYHADIKSGAAARWVGEVLVTDPGSATWAFKNLSGVTPSTLSENAIASLKAKRANYYITLGGVAITLDGVVASNEYIDTIIFADWIIARVTERVFALLVNSPKLPYSDTSVNLVVAEIMAVLQEGVAVGGLLPGDGDEIPAPSVIAPKVADVSPAERAARHLPDITFSGRLAGAIHSVDISGTLSV